MNKNNACSFRNPYQAMNELKKEKKE